MRLSEIEDERALDVLADIIDPVTEIVSDKNVEKLYKSGKPKLLIVKEILKNHKKPVIAILATLDGVKLEEYHFTLLDLPKRLMELLDDPELDALFRSQSQIMEPPNSGSVTESTKGEKQ